MKVIDKLEIQRNMILRTIDNITNNNESIGQYIYRVSNMIKTNKLNSWLILILSLGLIIYIIYLKFFK